VVIVARLPVPGSDDNNWGTILNEFLSVENNADGSLKIRTDGTLAPKIELAEAGTVVGTRKRLNLIAGSNITVSAADNAADDRIDVSFASTAVALSALDQQQLATQRSRALLPWFNGLANRHYARCNVVCVGDSISEGQGATQIDRRWIARLRDNLRTQHQTTGVTGGGRGFLGVTGSGQVSFTWPTTINGSPTPATTLGPKGQFLQLTASGQSIVYNLVGDSADIMWTQVPFGGTFSWSVDGGGATNISTNGGAIVDGMVTHISLGSAGAHTLTLAWVSGSSNVDGVVEYNGDYTAGIQVHDAAHYGWQTSNWVSVTSSSTASPAKAIAALSPSLLLITLGVNDQFAGVTPATFQANLTTIISQLRAAASAPYPAVVINMLPERTGQSGYTYPWSQYIGAARAVASADTGGPASSSIVTVMDFTLGPRMLGADTDVYGGWPGGDLVHPSDKGHSLLADTMVSFLAPA
jgi:lysophospholipase L1-like esterase